MNNRMIFAIAMVAVTMMVGPASAATPTAGGTNATIPAWDTGVVIANNTNLTIGFDTLNDSVVNASNWTWCINITNPTGEDFQWISIDVWNGTGWSSSSGTNNTTFLANATTPNTANTTGWTYGILNTTNYTAIISLTTTNSTVHLGGFDINITNSGNASEWAKLSELNFTAGPVVAAQSEIVNESASKVANGTDKMPMRLALRDTNGNPVLSLSSGPTITAANLNVTGTGTVSDKSSINQTTGNVTFNITATKAGVYNVSAVCDGVTIINQTTVFVAGPAYKLAWYGDTSSEPGGNSITQYVAIQDVNGNNVTWDTLEGSNPHRLIVTTIAGHATIASTNPLIVDEVNATSVKFMGTNYTSTFELINFTINNVFDETTTIKVQGNRTSSAETSLTYYGVVDHLAVTTNKTSMYANDGNDHILVTVQLKDENDANVDSDGVTITLGSDSPLFFSGLGVIKDAGDDAPPLGVTVGINNTVNGVATFIVESTTLSGSDEIDASTTAGKMGSSSLITLMPAPKIVNCAVVNTTATINAGSTSVITATIKDYNNSQVMSGWAVTFNITSGDGTFVGESSPYTTNTDSNGNVTASVTSTNVSTTIKVNVTIVDENTVTKQIGDYEHSFEVDPAAITKLVIDPVSKGLTNVNGTVATFNVTTTDVYGNLNTTALNLNVTNSNEALGNMSVYGSATHVNNNLSLTTANGCKKFNFTVNSTIAASATLNVTANTIYNAGKIANNISKTALVTTSGPTGVIVSFNKTAPVVGETVAAYAQLTDANGNPLGIAGKVMTFTVAKGGATIAVSVNTTNVTGVALYNMTVSELGTYTVTASNSTLGLSNASSITFAGPMVSIVATANGTTGTHSTPVNSVVTVNATAKDSAGNVATSAGGTVTFLVNSASIGSAAFANGVASITYTKATAGTYTVTTWYNATVSDTVDVTFTDDAALTVDTITIAPAGPLTLNVTETQTFTATCYNNSTVLTGITVTWNSSNTTVGSNPASGVFTADANGTTSITAATQGVTSNAVAVTVGTTDDWNTWDDDCSIGDTEISLAEYHWATSTLRNGHLITDAEISLLEYQWATGDVC